MIQPYFGVGSSGFGYRKHISSKVLFWLEAANVHLNQFQLPTFWAVAGTALGVLYHTVPRPPHAGNHSRNHLNKLSKKPDTQ